ncbi:ribosome biogenesis GTPase Der [Candidatus Peribacteria bacterium]|jgi:GTPase|nr:ribosome biogenesis GTPase Der [Candidatus Peribacteria bacterium]MBT4021332.1 ribosome biogenesis GTPase Der [Candidatus Peribacteria bacterium]MBT4241207.1 ribosome biogenesis GTPase Der [Candidatus Peribacteria bacterium]MBT4474232.1 ribosome biogenesis GTPase Der [Candidatus Peribacteria bacterium]
MAKLPVVAIIGRPNTGKSTLFNRIVGRRHAIVSDTPGTTRDPIAVSVSGDHLTYLLMDTGGMGGGTEDEDFEDDVESQSVIALEHSDLIVFVVDSREELTSSDYEVVNFLRKKRKNHVPVILVPSKCDNAEAISDVVPKFFELDVADNIIPVSASHGLGIDELEEVIEEKLLDMHFGDQKDSDEEDTTTPRIALVGRPNVGKSSIVNSLMSDPQRKVQGRIVSDVPGTTRDTADTSIKYHEKEYLLLDTAGLKKKREFGIEAYAALRTLSAVESADVTVLVIDPTLGIGRQDKRIAALAIERGTGLVILVNKIDLLEPEAKEYFRNMVRDAFAFCKWAPVLFTSADTRENLTKIFEIVEKVYASRKVRIETPKLNRWFRDIAANHRPKGIGGKSAKAKYMTQVDIAPPSFAVFMNDASRMHFSYLRFMENQLREEFGFEGTPIRWVKRSKS